jgi:hypothetical protein
MKRLLGLAVLALPLAAAPANAQGCWGPGYFNAGANLKAMWGRGAPPGGGKPQVNPGVYGPWYNYWPLEAHFQAPAWPQYPYWPSPQTLPNGAPVAAPMTVTYPGAPAAPPPYPPPAYNPGATAYGYGGYPPPAGYYPTNGYPAQAQAAPPQTPPAKLPPAAAPTPSK